MTDEIVRIYRGSALVEAARAGLLVLPDPASTGARVERGVLRYHPDATDDEIRAAMRPEIRPQP